MSYGKDQGEMTRITKHIFILADPGSQQTLAQQLMVLRRYAVLSCSEIKAQCSRLTYREILPTVSP